MERMTLREFEMQWTVLLNKQLQVLPDNLDRDKVAAEKEVLDPFECTSLEIPPTRSLVDRQLDQFVEEWRELDERKISLHNPNDTNNPYQFHHKVACDSSTGMPKWFVNPNRVRLPANFDFLNQHSPPNESDGEDKYRVLSLIDPTKTTSYHYELWKMFDGIPTVDQIERNAVGNPNLSHMENIWKELKQQQSTKTDSTDKTLESLRISDRHDAPPPLSSPPMVSTLRFECWRTGKPVKPSPLPDPSRMAVEFLGSQSLLDFHNAIVELTDDTLWNDNSTEDSTEDTECTNHQGRSIPLASGYFFIEGTFYTVGSTDYVSSIRNWLTAGSLAEQTQRAEYLGLSIGSICDLPVKSMDHIRLEDLALRLGVRYVHVHNGDVECSVFVVDRRFRPKARLPYPVLHDIWTNPFTTPVCDACQHSTTVWVTSPTCQVTDGGPRFLCQGCCRALQVPAMEVERFSTWKGASYLSQDKDQSKKRKTVS